ncbi:hypothetical protein [Methylotuvimicrobium sp. KM1]|uniref:hypothetical protein n=1 Tax=Methylotuvimicrobium sp. KM1 TaxID=3377707 RepID=UPI00384C8026
MDTNKVEIDDLTFSVEQITKPVNFKDVRQITAADAFERSSIELNDFAHMIVDNFDKTDSVSCCFIRLSSDGNKTVRFSFNGSYQLETCAGGGWLFKPTEAGAEAYWIPLLPMVRSFDPQGRILSEKPANLLGFDASLQTLSIDIAIPENLHLDCTIWRFSGEESKLLGELENLYVLEKQPVFLFSSHSKYQQPADLYKHLIHGHVYENQFNWSHKRKICSELDAYSLYLALAGLELATNKKIYGLLKRQIVYSVIARQAEDGGWHHGEWTDLMESHFRLHCGGMLLLEAALDNEPDNLIRTALEKAAAFIAKHTDNTQLGIWFLHDALEQSTELMNKSGSRWIPSTFLGKSPTNKMILNTHLDTIVAMDRYRECTGDQQYNDIVTSACKTAEAVLNLKPAEWLYRPLFKTIGLTLLPEQEAKNLPLPMRAIKRLTWKHLIPKLHIIKRRYPRFVMPGGIIERHLSPIHFNVRYQSVNIMDLTRYLRRFPSQQLQGILDEAIKAIANTSFLEYLAESKSRQDALAFWAEALYHLCMLHSEPIYRHYLAEAIIYLDKTGQGLPPSLLGANPEVVQKVHSIPCLLPSKSVLRAVNLSRVDHKEFLLINTSKHDSVKLTWENNKNDGLKWFNADEQIMSGYNSSPSIVPQSWIWGREI